MGSTVLAAGAETGTTSVSMSVDGPRLRIDLTTDPETLLARLDRLAGRGREAAPATGRWADVIVRRQAELLRHVVVQFDDRAARETKVAQVQVETVTASATDAADESSSRVTIRFSTTVPDDAGSVRWTYALASAAYPLAVRQGVSVVSETIAGADSSGPVALVNHRPPATERRVWAVVVPVLFAALVTLRVRERRSRPVVTPGTTTRGASVNAQRRDGVVT
jgi:hypothetical protein